MHELSLCESVLRIIREQARQRNFHRVKTVRVSLGVLSCCSPEAIDFCFKAVTWGTLAEGARLELVRLPGYAWCMNCGETVAIRERYDPCPQCGSFEMQITGGDEMRISELEVE
jgi:hydrogenase nickel incorporation protein HypA/HybF